VSAAEADSRSDSHASGSHLAAVSRRVVGLIKQHYGKGPTGARTYQSGNLVVVILTGGYTTVEKTLIASGRPEAVSAQRGAFQDAMRPLFKQVVEEELRRPVIAFMSATHQDPDLSAEVFILEDDDGAAEIEPPGGGSQDGLGR
jgi:uncharacterized protein YbcI